MWFIIDHLLLILIYMYLYRELFILIHRPTYNSSQYLDSYPVMYRHKPKYTWRERLVFSFFFFFVYSQPEAYTPRQSSITNCQEINCKTIKICTVNTEGVKSNVPFLIELSKCEQIICVQEHWLNDYGQFITENLIPNYTSFVRC